GDAERVEQQARVALRLVGTDGEPVTACAQRVECVDATGKERAVDLHRIEVMREIALDHVLDRRGVRLTGVAAQRAFDEAARADADSHMADRGLAWQRGESLFDKRRVERTHDVGRGVRERAVEVEHNRRDTGARPHRFGTASGRHRAAARAASARSGRSLPTWWTFFVIQNASSSGSLVTPT